MPHAIGDLDLLPIKPKFLDDIHARIKPFLERLTAFQLRLLSAGVMLVAALVFIAIGGWFFTIPLWLISLLAYYEWVGLFFKNKRVLPKDILACGWGALTLTAFLAMSQSLVFMVLFLLLAMVGVALVVYLNDKIISPLAASFGVPYIGVTMAILIYLRDNGLVGVTGSPVGGVVTLLLIVWTTDTAAYFVGKNFGKHKLAPTISPGKTVEGLIGAVVASAFVGALAAKILLGVNPALFMWIGGFLAVVAQGGDLFESALKRSSGKKDSGNIIPGHGGILDRIDGLLAAAPFYMLFLSCYM